MTESLKIGAYWLSRRESLEDCTDRLSLYLERLGEIHPSLSQWYEKGRSRRDALTKPFDRSRTSVSKLLLAGRNRRDVEPRTVIEDLGYRVALWNGQRHTDAALSVHCGAYWEQSTNVVLLTLPEPEGASLELYEKDVLEAIFEETVRCWDPNWETVISSRLRRAQRGEPIAFGWSTYVNRKLSFASLPPSLEAQPLGIGTVIRVRAAATADLDSAIDEARRLFAA